MNSNVRYENITHKQTKKIKEYKIIYYFFKRLIDIIGGILGSLTLIPITMIIYIARHRLKESHLPLFYTQLRIGKNGKQFKIYKYRTMVIDAEEKLETYLNQNEEAKKEYNKYKKLEKDPRITKLGGYLRKFKLDEFPQFINVLKGDMSIVGPRPYLPKEIKDMGETYKKIITVKPGITGYWQTNAKRYMDFKQRNYMDIDYINNKNLRADMKYIIMTIKHIIAINNIKRRNKSKWKMI
ncbi:MAG: sugar transferase [Clostridia bacterium]|nr:sugar transferase [Clostridia bacterium]